MGFHHLLERNLLIAIIISLFVVPGTILSSAECFAGKYYVNVADKLPNNSNPLTVHCQSKDNDIGYHTLHANQDFQWHFCNNGWTTLFFCHFWWDQRQAVFDVFTQSIAFECDDNSPGKDEATCHWEARVDGFYLGGNKRQQWQ